MWDVVSKLGAVEAAGRPVRMVLDDMGLDLHSSLCPRCQESIETINHALINCGDVKKLWERCSSGGELGRLMSSRFKG